MFTPRKGQHGRTMSYSSWCKECAKAWHHKVAEKRKANKLCRRCGGETDGHQACCKDCLTAAVDAKKTRYQEHKEKVTYGIRLSIHRAKVRAMVKLGGLKCSGCGETDYRTLTIDHREGCGSKERVASNLLHLRILKDKTDITKLRVFCANCQARHEYKRGKRKMYPEIEEFVAESGGSIPPWERFEI